MGFSADEVDTVVKLFDTVIPNTRTSMNSYNNNFAFLDFSVYLSFITAQY